MFNFLEDLCSRFGLQLMLPATGRLEVQVEHTVVAVGISDQIQGSPPLLYFKALDCISALHVPAWCGCPAESTDGDQIHASNPWPSLEAAVSSGWHPECSYFPTILKISLKYALKKKTHISGCTFFLLLTKSQLIRMMKGSLISI